MPTILSLLLAVAIPLSQANGNVVDSANLLSATEMSQALGVIHDAPLKMGLYTVPSLEGVAERELGRQVRDAWHVDVALVIALAEHRLVIQPTKEWSATFDEENSFRIIAEMSAGMRKTPGANIVKGLKMMSNRAISHGSVYVAPAAASTSVKSKVEVYHSEQEDHRRQVVMWAIVIFLAIMVIVFAYLLLSDTGSRRSRYGGGGSYDVASSFYYSSSSSDSGYSSGGGDSGGGGGGDSGGGDGGSSGGW